MSTIRVGIIGAGRNARERHIPGSQGIDDVEVVAVCNRSIESGARVAEEFHIPHVTTDPEELFVAHDIDAICIGTWPYAHREYTVRALEAGKHVLCEARMAMDIAEARAMLAAAAARPDLVAQLVPVTMDFRSLRTAQRILGDGSLGDIREVHVTSLNDSAMRDAARGHWREQRRYSGLNAMNLGMLNEVVLRWLGETERVVADGTIHVARPDEGAGGAEDEADVFNSLGVLARMRSGARVTYRVGTVVHGAGGGNGISVYGSAGTLHWSADDSMQIARAGAPLTNLEPDPGTPIPWRVEADFVASIRTGAPVEFTSFEDGVRYMQFTEAVARSIETGAFVDLDSV